MKYYQIDKKDNVQICLQDGQKYALCAIAKGEAVIKYGFPIGTASADIAPGELVHTHNLQTALRGETAYTYVPAPLPETAPEQEPVMISAYARPNGEIGIRNDIWIVPTVGCVNGVVKTLARKTGAFALTHPYGCSQLGDDLAFTQKTLCQLIKHPNAGGVLVVGLGCENNNIAALQKCLGTYDSTRIKFLNVQDVTDEIASGLAWISQLQDTADRCRRTSVPLSRLKIGLKCGGSDGLSGITANPLVGRITDRITAAGGCAVLTEVPEMFGAEQVLLPRCTGRPVFEAAAQMINNYKKYFLSHGQPVSENPSPGNKAGGITTLEEKSLGCVQKGGRAPVTAVLHCGETACTPGLNLLNGPGNDMVAVTNLTAAGCHLILFTTGRGTPLGAPVPVLKIASNTALAQKKKGWIDLDAQTQTEQALFDLLVKTANGEKTKNEIRGDYEIALFKDGVTL